VYGTAARITTWMWVALMWSLMTLAGCGSGGNNAEAPAPLAACDPNDPATANECGTVLVGFTDADGDFHYTVDVCRPLQTQVVLS
jgi:hypothetical protein